MKCPICSHPQRPAIDQALLAANLTCEALGQTWGLSVSDLQRHQRHLAANVERTRQRLRDSQGQITLLKLSDLLASVQRAVQQAEADGNVNLVLKGAQIGSRLLRQIGQLEVSLEPDTIYRLIFRPQWGARDSFLPGGPEIILEIHRALRDTALTPCPAGEPETISRAAADAPDIEPKKKREKSAKLPKKSSRRDKKNKQKHRDRECEKNLPKNPAPVCSGSAAAAAENSFSLPGAGLAPEPAAAHPLPTEREKSAKLPKLSSRWEDNDEEYQVVCLEEKNYPKNPGPVGSGPETAGPASDPPSRGFTLPPYVFLRGERYFRPGIF